MNSLKMKIKFKQIIPKIRKKNIKSPLLEKSTENKEKYSTKKLFGVEDSNSKYTIRVNNNLNTMGTINVEKNSFSGDSCDSLDSNIYISVKPKRKSINISTNSILNSKKDFKERRKSDFYLRSSGNKNENIIILENNNINKNSNEKNNKELLFYDDIDKLNNYEFYFPHNNSNNILEKLKVNSNLQTIKSKRIKSSNIVSFNFKRIVNRIINQKKITYIAKKKKKKDKKKKNSKRKIFEFFKF